MSFDNVNCDYNHPGIRQQQINTHQFSLNPSTSVMVSPVADMQYTAVIAEQKPSWSWTLTVSSILNTLFCSCCCIPFAFIGTIQSIHAYIDHKVGDYRRSANKRQCAWGFTITGFVIAITLWIALCTKYHPTLDYILRLHRSD